MNTWNFYKELSNGLLDNLFDALLLRSRNELDNIEPKRLMNGTGILLYPTGRNRRRNENTTTNISYQGRFCVFVEAQ